MKKRITTLFVLTLLSFTVKQSARAATLYLKLYIEIHYVGSGSMMSSPCGGGNGWVDTLTVELHDALSPSVLAASSQGILFQNGTMNCTFPNSTIGNAYYIVIKSRNLVETWSGNSVAMASSSSYDFTNGLNKAYGGNQKFLGGGGYGMFTGDINQDGVVDLLDFPPMDFAIKNGLTGCIAPDLNGDGNVDLLDFAALDLNITRGIYSHHP